MSSKPYTPLAFIRARIGQLDRAAEYARHTASFPETKVTQSDEHLFPAVRPV